MIRTPLLMKFLPRLVLAAIAFAGAFTLQNPADAADGAAPSIPGVNVLEGKARQELEVMMEKLKLSDAQKVEVRPVFEGALVRGNALLKETLAAFTSKKSSEQKAAALEKTKQELKTLRDDTDARLAQILTPEQMEEMKRLRNERKGQLKKEYPVKKPS